MAKYTVIKKFKDRDTKNIYEPGDAYPAKGRAKKARIEELLKHPSHDYAAFIEEVDKEQEPPEETPEENEETAAGEQTPAEAEEQPAEETPKEEPTKE